MFTEATYIKAHVALHISVVFVHKFMHSRRDIVLALRLDRILIVLKLSRE